MSTVLTTRILEARALASDALRKMIAAPGPVYYEALVMAVRLLGEIAADLGAAATDFFWPVDSEVVTQKFGARPNIYRKYKMRGMVEPAHDGHEGADFRTGHRGKIYSIADGIVYRVEERGAYGYHIRIEHLFAGGPQLRSVYGHMERGSSKVKVGDRVWGGQLIGFSGLTGHVAGEHLHLSIWKLTDDGWKMVDPLLFLSHVPQGA